MKLKNKVKNWILKHLKKRGYELLKTQELNDRVEYYKKVLETSKIGTRENKIDSIVFSKDRAIQLHAFLKSYAAMVSGRGTMYILFKTSNEKHVQSYKELKEIFEREDVVFVEETDFRKQFIQLCEHSNAKTIGTYVDDMIFLKAVDYAKILAIDALNNIVSLGRGKELDYSLVLQKSQPLPNFLQKSDGFEYFKWDYTEEYNDWTYPLGVGGYFFDRDEMVIMLKGIKFKAPNSLENNLQVYKPMFIHRHGVCMEQVACVAVHANLVQTESVNPVLGTFSIEGLLAKWEAGLAIDISKFYGVKGSIAQFQTYEFVKR